ncbi:MAG TPA: hypothetical protein VK653_12460 [Xanthobacteraceae bacterium]|jgi:hypothetical protein|nr:hypothetical protein [Xanthobacteraceae bacterium]
MNWVSGSFSAISGKGTGMPTAGFSTIVLPRWVRTSAADRITWLKMLAMAFQMSYGLEPEIEIKEAAN